MADSTRVLPTTYGIIHHAVTPLYTNKSDREIRDIFDRFGRAIYNYGTASYVHPGHYHPDTGAPTHAQVQFAIRPYTLDGNKYGYRMTELMRDVEGSTCWGAGNWEVNRRAMQVEFCMDARTDRYDDKAFMLVADTWRKYDQKVNGAFNVFGHSQVSQLGTQCPAWLLEKIGLIIDMMNRPDHYNAILWPAPKPAAPAVKETNRQVFSPLKKFKFNKAARLYDVLSGAVSGDKTYPQGEEIEFKQLLTISNGKKYYRTVYSSDKEIGTGFRQEDVTEVVAAAPAPKPTPAPVTPVPVPEIPTAPAVAKSKYTKFDKPRKYIANVGAQLWNLDAAKWGDFKPVKILAPSEPIEAVGQAEHPLGGVYIMTAYSFGKADETGKPSHNNGVNLKDVVEAPEPAPQPSTPEPVPAPTEPEVKPTPTPEPKPTEPVPSTNPVPSSPDNNPKDGEDAHTWLGRIWAWVVGHLKNFKFKK